VGSARLLLVAGNLALAALLAATAGTEVGTSRLHHDLAYAGLALAALLALPLLRRRRVTTLLLASCGSWCLLTGLWLVYVTPSEGGGRWMSWWHGVTGVAFLLAFLAHWARNHPRLVGLSKRLGQRAAPLAAVLLAWALLLAAGWASWATPLRALFDDGLFLLLSTAALSGVAVAAMGAGLVLTSRRLRPVLERTDARNRLRGAVDASLLGMTWLAALTGFPLLYLGRALRGADAYWLVTGWHVVLGALLVGLAAFHVAFNRRPLAAHAR
jgi:hypothetical protein